MQNAAAKTPLATQHVELVGACKGKSADTLQPFLKEGLLHYGENRVQEAQKKWLSLKKAYPDAKLHLIGPLQSNKAAQAVALFDVIETVDREKIALKLGEEMHRQGRHLPCLIQVNIGKEPQKAGIMPENLAAFVTFCRDEAKLLVEGLMCVPPAEKDPAAFFALMRELAKRHGLKTLSMGMSGDYETAIAFGATHVRIGTALFGARDATSPSPLLPETT